MPPYKPPSARSRPWAKPFSSSSPSGTSDRESNSNSNSSKPYGSTYNPAQTNSSNKGRSNPLSRLRPAPIQADPLEAAGLPSKGDKTLLDLKAQEIYYATLEQRYYAWCLDTKTPAVQREIDLEKSMTGMSLDGSSFYGASKDFGKTGTDGSPGDDGAASTGNSTTTEPKLDAKATQELSRLQMSMRKLREAILSTKRTDAFAQKTYVFIARAGVLSRAFESYHPALLHLIYGIHPMAPLPTNILHEFVGYHILDTACRLGNYGEAFALRAKWKHKDRVLDDVLTALVRDDWVSFWEARKTVDGYRRSLMGWAEDGVRKHALKCIGKAYLSVNRNFVERAAGDKQWNDLVQQDHLGWEEDGNMIVVRKVKAAAKIKG